MHLVQCSNKECAATAAVMSSEVDVHDALDVAGCTCCPVQHNHGAAARETGVPCRPVTITLVPGSVEVS